MRDNFDTILIDKFILKAAKAPPIFQQNIMKFILSATHRKKNSIHRERKKIAFEIFRYCFDTSHLLSSKS